MTGIYRTTDGGLHWTMMDQHKVQSLMVNLAQGTVGFSVAFDPSTPGHIVGFNPSIGLVESFDTGNTWNAFSPAVPASIVSATFSPDSPARLLVATTNGVYELQSGAWHLTLTAAGAFKVIFVKDPSSGRQVAYAAANGNLYQQAASGTWVSFSSGLPFSSKQIYDIAGGADTTHYAVYASFSTANADIGTTGGVYRYASNSPSWTRQSSGLNGANGTITRDPDCDGGGAPQYRFLGVAAATPDSAYVTAINTTCGNSVYKGTFSTQMNWTATYDGYQNHTTTNLTGGWSDQQQPVGMDWGFGGSANGFTVAPGNGNTAVFVNEATVDITANGGTQWTARYTNLISGTANNTTGRWQTNGVDVTTTWNYYVHPDPTKTGIHFIANTDIGLSRSTDTGSSWEPITPTSHLWKNFYELTFEYPSGSRIWAAVSNQHDIPHETQLGVGPGIGGVLVSSDDGATWTQLTTTGLPAGPVVSIVYHSGTLYASVWTQGVYQSTDGGSTWAAVGTFTNKHVDQLRFDASGALYVAVAADISGAGAGTPPTNGFVNGGLYKLVSGSWQKLTSNLESQFATLHKGVAPFDFSFDPANSDAIYMGLGDIAHSNGGFGLYKYSMSAGTWTEMGLATAVGGGGTQVVFAPAVIGGTLYATTLGNGIWQTTNGGSTWSEFTAIPFLSSQRISSFGGQMYITTFGGGAWKPGTTPPPPPPGPTVNMTAPASGATVSGTITLSANASDASGIAGVQFLVDGTAIGTEITTSPYTTSFNTTTVADGTHTFTARARNTSNVTTTSSGVSVTVSNSVAPAQLTVTTAMALSPTSPAVSQSDTATFTVTNTGGQAITVQSFVVGARDPSNANVDFPATAPVTLTPGQSYSYSQARTFATAGTYSAWPSYFDGTNWFQLVAPVNFTVTQPSLFTDNFNRTTGLGANWAILYGNYSTNGTQAVSGTVPAQGNWAHITPALGTNNYSVAADIIVPAGSLDSGLVARSSDSANFDRNLYSAQIATDGNIYLYRRNDWNWTTLSSFAAGITANTSYNLKLIVTGSSPVHLEVWLNGVQKIVFNDSSTSQITTGNVGVENYDPNVKYDNFTVNSQ